MSYRDALKQQVGETKSDSTFKRLEAQQNVDGCEFNLN